MAIIRVLQAVAHGPGIGAPGEGRELLHGLPGSLGAGDGPGAGNLEIDDANDPDIYLGLGDASGLLIRLVATWSIITGGTRGSSPCTLTTH